MLFVRRPAIAALFFFLFALKFWKKKKIWKFYESTFCDFFLILTILEFWKCWNVDFFEKIMSRLVDTCVFFFWFFFCRQKNEVSTKKKWKKKVVSNSIPNNFFLFFYFFDPTTKPFFFFFFMLGHPPKTQQKINSTPTYDS